MAKVPDLELPEWVEQLLSSGPHVACDLGRLTCQCGGTHIVASHGVQSGFGGGPTHSMVFEHRTPLMEGFTFRVTAMIEPVRQQDEWGRPERGGTWSPYRDPFEILSPLGPGADAPLSVEVVEYPPPPVPPRPEGAIDEISWVDDVWTVSITRWGMVGWALPERGHPGRSGRWSPSVETLRAGPPPDDLGETAWLALYKEWAQLKRRWFGSYAEARDWLREGEEMEELAAIGIIRAGAEQGRFV